jgi:DNA-binding NtrC family response regulator
MKEKILVVDDERRIRLILRRLLQKRGYEVDAAESGERALELSADSPPDLVLLDLKMPGIGGLETLKALQNRCFPGKVVILTAFGTISSAVEAMRLGAYDYITKPFVNEELMMAVERALDHQRAKRELAEARRRLEESFSIGGIITGNAEMKNLLDVVNRIAPTDTPALIQGESGTGKELFAQAIHQHSPRKNRRFVAINCSALPNTLIESELFGYKKGAFSGAEGSKPGLVEKADGGTLFLDEVAEMGPDAQAKLLRFAQSGEFIPLGGTEMGRVNVRLIAASNRDLEGEVRKGRFRDDLFYRLNVVMLKIPPLRERPEDIPLLIDHFLNKFAPDLGKADYRFAPEALDLLQLYKWPGNVRELENAVRSALVMAIESPVGQESLPATVRVPLPVQFEQDEESTLREVVTSHQEALERKAIVKALSDYDGNRTRTAARLGISRNTLLRKIKRYGIR